MEQANSENVLEGDRASSTRLWISVVALVILIALAITVYGLHRSDMRIVDWTILFVLVGCLGRSILYD